jgi:mono/diheme cytochrome c family protein
MRGPELFDKHCAGCHRDASKINLDEDIVDFIRFPNSPMPAFDASKISDKEARLIADYIKLQVYYASKR